jgi:Swt1-like HEPN
MDYDSLYSFVFKGLLTEEALDSAGRQHRHVFSEGWESETSIRLAIPFLDEELVKKSRNMAVVYTAICAFENSVRDFISRKLLEEKGENWWELCVKAEIRKKAEDRRNAEKDVRWLTPRGDSMIHYTDFGDLVAIMGKPENWVFFEVHIVSLDCAKQIINTLEKSRNVIMHSGELDPKDIERVGTYIRDWARQVG